MSSRRMIVVCEMKLKSVDLSSSGFLIVYSGFALIVTSELNTGPKLKKVANVIQTKHIEKG